MISETNGLVLKYQVARCCADLLRQWGLPIQGRCNSSFHYVFEIKRFQVWAYWRPMTVDRYERLTSDYLGPHIPLFASRTQYVEDEEVVYEGYDFCLRKHTYRYVPFYFVIPAFVLNHEWNYPREWRWSPAIRVTKGLMKSLLKKEVQYGGWQKNRRGRLLIPKRTGTSALLGPTQAGEGWASFGTRNSSEVSFDGEPEADRELSTDLSLSGSETTQGMLRASGGGQQSLPGF